MARRAWILAVLLGAVAAGSPAGAADWPGWRGDGTGVAHGKVELPIHWGPDENVIWKSPIEGAGLSSPVIWEDRVFVTTAYEGSAPATYRAIAAALLVLLVLVALGAVLKIAFRDDLARGEPSDLPGWLKLALLVDKGVTALALGLFSMAMLLLSYKLLFAPEFVTLRPSRAWIRAGKLSFLGLIAAAGGSRPRSRGRLLGAATLVAAALLFYFMAPYDKDAVATPKSWLLRLGGSMVLAALWNVFIYFAARRRARAGSRVGPAPRLAYPLALVAAVAVTFFAVGHIQSNIGLLRAVVCLDRASGEVLWQRAAFRAEAEPTPRNSRATPTVATDGEVLVAYFGHGLVGMDLDGNVKWRKMIPNYLDYIRYGVGSSPLLVGDKVIYPFFPERGTVARIRGEGREFLSELAYLAALDKHTGEEIWRTTPPTGHDTYTTPVVISHEGREMIVIPTFNHASAYDPETGEQLWVAELPLTQPVPSVVADETHVYVVGGVHGPASATSIALGGAGDVTGTHLGWQTTTGVAGVPSPLLYEGLLYWITERGILYCIDPANGERVWRGRIEDGRTYSGSPVAGDGKIFVPTDNGKIAVIEAGREFKILAINDLGEDSYSSPAIVDGQIFLRGIDHVYCVGGKRPS